MGYLRTATAATLVAATLGLTGCGGHGGTTAGHPVAASTASAATGTSQAPASMSTAEVERLWDETLVSCPRAASPSTPLAGAPQTVRDAWPTDEQVRALLTALQPHGTAQFTEAKLRTLRVALQDTRADLAYMASGDTPERQVDAVTRGWDLSRAVLIDAINAGHDRPLNPRESHVMEQVRTAEGELCR